MEIIKELYGMYDPVLHLAIFLVWLLGYCMGYIRGKNMRKLKKNPKHYYMEPKAAISYGIIKRT